MTDHPRTNRRAALRALATGGLAASAVLAAPNVARAQGRTARLVTTWSRKTLGYHESATRLAERITRMTGGRVTVELFASGELVPAFDTLETVQNGDAEMVHAISGYWRKLHPGFQLLNTVPNGFTCEENSAWLRAGGGLALWDQLYDRFNIKAFIAGGSGVQPGGWYARPITSLSDFKGLRFRISGYGGEVVERIGGTPVSLPASKLANAIFNDEIDAVEWNGPYSDAGFGFQKVLPYYLQPGFHDPGSTSFLGVNKDFFNSLDTQDQAIVQAACDAEEAYTLGEFRAKNGVFLKQLIDEYGARLVVMPEDLWQEAARMAEEVVAEKADFDDLSREIYASFLAFRSVIAPWSSTSSDAYARKRAEIIAAAPSEEVLFEAIDD